MQDWTFHWGGYLVAVIAGLLMLLALFRDRARGRSRCRKCWYDLKEIGGLPITCPECGKVHTKPEHLSKTRRHKRLAFVWLLVMVVGGYGMWVVPRVQDEGRHGLVPNFLLAHYVPHLSLRTANNFDRLDSKNKELFDKWNTPEGYQSLRRNMRIWLALGLVDPSGFYGDPNIKNYDDLSKNIGTWTGAGGAFQEFMKMEDLPAWARHTSMITQINAVYVWVKPADEEGDLAVARLIGNRHWDIQIGDMLIAITPRDGLSTCGVTVIGRKELTEKADASTLLFDDGEIDMLTPAVIAADEDGLYRASVRIVEQGELVGEFDIDFALRPYDWRRPDARVIKAVKTVRRDQ